MRVAVLSDALGAELVDFDITRPCTRDEQAELRKLFCEHHLLLVRGQEITPDDHDRFVGYFGPLQPSSYVTNEKPVATNKLNPGTERLVWHSDGTYDPHPWIAVSLWGQNVSPRATPTLYANGVRAADRLPADLRAKVESLSAVHLSDSQPYLDIDGTPIEADDVTHRRWLEVEIPSSAPPERFRRFEQPLVFQLPHSNRKTLLVHQLMTSHVVGLSPDESEALIEDLWQRIYADDNVYSHNWRTNDVVVWDNIALQHSRPEDMGGELRHLRRLSLAGWYTDDGVLDWHPNQPRSMADV